MTDNIDLSLDDIIKMNKKSSPNKQGNKPNKPKLQRLRDLGARSGIIRKGGPKQQVTRQQQQQQQASPKNEATMLHVANLHYNVSDSDVRELFRSIGPIKRAVVHYDKSGRSLGTADVTYATRDAAMRAIKRYHNLPLDGRPMNITLVPSQNTTRSPAKNRIGVKPGSGVVKKQPTKNTRGGPVGKGRVANSNQGKPNFQRGQRPQKKPVTAEQLDADLEAYTMNVD